MKLNDEEQDILAGKAGPVPQQALQHQIKVGDFFAAKDFVPVTQAHIMADTESLGEAGVQWLEGLAATTEGQHRVRIPTDHTPTSLNGWGGLGGVIGRLAGNYWAVPVIEGIEGAPRSDQLKHFGASMASFGSIALYHIVGLTPEATKLSDVAASDL